MSAGEIAGITIEAALEQVRLAFAERAMPVGATYCACCHDDAEMQRLLHTIPADMSDGDLGFLVHDAYWVGINWPHLAYYVPEMLARTTARYIFEEDMLLYKLAIATRPEETMASSSKVLSFIGESMNTAERKAISDYIQAVFDQRLHTLSYRDDASQFHELIAFLLRFDSSEKTFMPFLKRWMQTTDTMARTNMCLFLADYLLNHSDERPFPVGSYYGRDIAPLPENQAALDAIFAPETAAQILMDCADASDAIAPEWETGIGAAFDWAMTLAQNKAPSKTGG